jgi:hypothetical protein
MMEGPPRHKPGSENPPLEAQPQIRRRDVRIHNHRVKTHRQQPLFGDLDARRPSFYQAPMQEQLIFVGVLQGFQRRERE